MAPATDSKMPDAKLPNPRKNHLLATLADAEWQRWHPFLDYVELPLGHVRNH